MPLDRTSLTPAALETWPSATAAALPTEERDGFRQRRLAIELLAKGERIAEIEKRTGVGRRQLYNLVRRALKVHPDGRVFGFRALLPYLRVKAHERRAPLKRGQRQTGGYAGAMAQLLTRYPELLELLQSQIAERPLLFAQRPDGGLQVQGLRAMHALFLERCVELGLRESDYPLSKDQQGIRALSAVIKRLGAETFRQAAKASGSAHDKGRRQEGHERSVQAVSGPFQTVEFDGHKLDLRLSISYPDPFGFEQTLALNRIWVLVIVEVFTRAILGYELVLSAEYNRYDVIRAVQKAIEPHGIYPFSTPGLGYGRSGGFPSQHLPELAYACWEELRFDNARANLAADTLKVLGEELGCVAHAGPAADPDQRAIIERLFKTLTESMSHRLPASTGSNPAELRRLINAAGSKAQISMPLSELEELIEAVLASINGTPHESLGGRTPLQALEYCVRIKHMPVRHLPHPMRRNLCLLQMAHASRVSGSVARGVRPYISFYSVRYSSQAFCERMDLIGKPVLVYYNPDDIRTLRIFSKGGAEIGVIGAARPWGQAAHSLRMRQHITKLIRDGKLRLDAQSDPVQIYLKYKQKHASKSRKATGELEQARRSARNNAAPASTAPGPQYTPEHRDPAPGTAALPDTRAEPKAVKVRRLKIPSGFNR